MSARILKKLTAAMSATVFAATLQNKSPFQNCPKASRSGRPNAYCSASLMAA